MEFGRKYNKMIFLFGENFEELIKLTPFILFMKKMRPGEEKSFAQGHLASSRQSKNPKTLTQFSNNTVLPPHSPVPTGSCTNIPY